MAEGIGRQTGATREAQRTKAHFGHHAIGSALPISRSSLQKGRSGLGYENGMTDFAGPGGCPHLRPRNQLATSSTTPIAPDSMPCLARMRIRPVSCPGKNVGSESAGTRKYIAATIRKITPRMVTIAFMLTPPYCVRA